MIVITKEYINRKGWVQVEKKMQCSKHDIRER